MINAYSLAHSECRLCSSTRFCTSHVAYERLLKKLFPVRNDTKKSQFDHSARLFDVQPWNSRLRVNDGNLLNRVN